MQNKGSARSFKVTTDVSTNQKPVCNFLLLNNECLAVKIYKTSVITYLYLYTMVPSDCLLFELLINLHLKYFMCVCFSCST